MIPGLEADFSSLYLRRSDFLSFDRLPGFSKGKHTIPDRKSSSAAIWAKSLLEEELREEMKEVYNRSKRELGLRHGQIKKHLFEGGASVECKIFSFWIGADQDPADPGMAKIVRQINVFVPLADLPLNFDMVFPKSMEEIVLPLKGAPVFDELVPIFEEIVDRRGGSLTDDEEKGEVEYLSRDGSIRIFVKLHAKELVLRPRSQKSCLALLKDAQENLG